MKLTHRLVLNYYTAKRLLGALHMAVQQHENMYGVLEIDVTKRRTPHAPPHRGCKVRSGQRRLICADDDLITGRPFQAVRFAP